VALDCPAPVYPEPPAAATEHTVTGSELPEGFETLPMDRAAEALLRAHWRDLEVIAETEAKRKALAEYIEAIVREEARVQGT
jgi:hypothetical protein